MPGPIVDDLQSRLPTLNLYNACGQSEVGPLATVLNPEGHKITLTSEGRPVLNLETRVVNEQMEETAPGRRRSRCHWFTR